MSDSDKPKGEPLVFVSAETEDRSEEVPDLAGYVDVAEVTDSRSVGIALMLRLRLNSHGGLEVSLNRGGGRREVQVDSDWFLADTSKPRDGVVVGNTRMADGGWSNEYVHGPDVMLPVGKLLSELLLEGERICAIDSLQFRRLITGNLRFSVAVGAIPSDLDVEDKPAVVGKFSTNLGRSLVLRGDLNGVPLNSKAAANPFAKGIAVDFDTYEVEGDHNEDLVFDLRSISVGSGLSAMIDGNEVGILTNTLMDVVLRALSKINRKRLGCYADDGIFAGSFEELKLGDLKKLTGGGSLRITMRPVGERKLTPNNFVIIPFDFAFVGDGEEFASGKVTLAAPKDKRAMSTFMAKSF